MQPQGPPSSDQGPSRPPGGFHGGGGRGRGYRRERPMTDRERREEQSQRDKERAKKRKEEEAAEAEAEAQEERDPPFTTAVWPTSASMQGTMLFVFGRNFTENTVFTFDWPYAEPSGWSFTVEPELVNETSALVRAPPMYCSIGRRKEVKAYILADNANSKGGGKGDAQFAYLFGREETEHMAACLKKCLYEIDDGVDVTTFGPNPPSALKELNDEEIIEEHLYKRHKRDKLLPVVTHKDAQGRTAVHYLAALADKEALRFLIEHLPKQAFAQSMAVTDMWYLTPTHLAVAFQRPSTVSLLLEHSTPASRTLMKTPTAETQVTVYTLAAGDDELEYELDKGIDEAIEAEQKASQPVRKKRKKTYQGPDINISKVDDDGAICLSD
eukprot:TRINITY_DN61812_c0_g1_i2.p1 TRINITY_DN61812_c0_g1~~TRINITY_DN61812_c0_g1_i2.p1  ORF type:complete len:384 (-),score=51.02 TRINITY_DN61812_c0_g1_i2:106-1257(-)